MAAAPGLPGEGGLDTGLHFGAEYQALAAANDAADAEDYVAQKLMDAVDDGAVEVLPALYAHRAVWRLQLGLSRKAEKDLLAALRCPLSRDAALEVRALLIECYNVLGRADDAARVADELRGELAAAPVVSALLLRSVVAARGGNGGGVAVNGGSPSPTRRRPPPAAAAAKAAAEPAAAPRDRHGGGGSAAAAAAAPSGAVPSNGAAKPVKGSMSKGFFGAAKRPASASPSPAASPAPAAAAPAPDADADDDGAADVDIALDLTGPPGTAAVEGTSAAALEAALNTPPKLSSAMSMMEQQRLMAAMGSIGACLPAHPVVDCRLCLLLP